MNDDRLSKTDELAEILDEYRSKKASELPASNEAEPSETDLTATVAIEPKSSPSPTVLSDTDETPVIPDGSAQEATAEDEAIALHFSEAEDALDGNSGASSHFTDLSGAEPPDPEEEEKEEDDAADSDAMLSRPGRIFKRVCTFFANTSFLAKAVLYIVVVLIVAAYLSYFVISIGNDLFALVTGSAEIKITLPENATEEEVTELLFENGLIEYKWVFSLFMQHYGDGEALQFIAGEHTLNTNMNYSQLLNALTTTYQARKIVTLTFPEGYTVDDIIDLFVENGIGTREGFIEAINEYPYKHEFVRLLDENGWPEDRVYRLEGYLYPDTYDFYTDTEEYLAINKLLNNFNDKVWLDWKVTYSEICEAEGFTLDDIVTLASMVEAEGKTAEDFECISYVFHNRLSHSDNFPKLESDATIQYAYQLAGQDRIQDASQIDVNFDSPYNTYLYDGLPPGAICNAGLDAILAAIYPSPPLDENGKEIKAYFFVSNNAGKTYYAATISGHENNKERVKRENEAAAAGNND